MNQLDNPRLDLIVGPNGSGKSTLARMIHADDPHLPFVNADEIARIMSPDDVEAGSYAAAQEAERLRNLLIDSGISFMAETVFSHPSKLSILPHARRMGFRVVLHAVMITEDMAVERVEYRKGMGGHSVPEEKNRARYKRLWKYVAAAISLSDQAYIYDNSGSHMEPVARFHGGVLVTCSRIPEWTPKPIFDLLDSTPPT